MGVVPDKLGQLDKVGDIYSEPLQNEVNIMRESESKAQSDIGCRQSDTGSECKSGNVLL